MSPRRESLVRIYKAQLERSHLLYTFTVYNSQKMVAAYELANEYRILYCLTAEAMYDEMAKVWESTGNNHLAAFRLDANS